MRYTAPKDVAVTGTDREGTALEISFEKGSYTTKDEAEIALLNRLAADPDSPVERAKEAKD